MAEPDFSEAVNPATLYLVATPIGNRADWSYRAPAILRRMTVILAEDTRVTGMLCRQHGIAVPMLSFHAHNQRQRVAEAVSRLTNGECVALVSDRGMPAISDPGQELVAAVWEAGLAVRVVPGPSAVTAAFAVSGFPHPFIFWGFVPRHGREREIRLGQIKESRWTGVIYEAPHRMAQTLNDLARVLGPGRRALVAREMTKRYEEYRRETLERLAGERSWRGELVLVVEPEPVLPETRMAAPDWATLEQMVAERVAGGQKEKEAIRDFASQWGINKRELYRRVQQGKMS